MSPVATIEEANRVIEEYQGAAGDFQLPIANSLLDPVGAHMAIITDMILAKGFEPDGYEEKDGYRLYKYKDLE
jgi:hypothetical protein